MLSLDRRHFLLSAAALAVAGGTSHAGAATAEAETLDTILAEILRAPHLLRSSALSAPAEAGFPDLSFEASANDAARIRRWLARLAGLPATSLDGDAQDSLGALRWDLEAGLDWHRHYWFESPLHSGGAALSAAVDQLASAQLRSSEERDRYLALLETVPAYVGQIAEKLRGQLTRGILLHRDKLAAALDGIDGQAAAEAFVPATERLGQVAPSDAARFRARATAIAESQVIPALRGLAAFLRADYLPRTDDQVGLWRFADGADYYRFLIRYSLTREFDPEEAHRGALADVAEADVDLAALRRELGFQGSARAFHDELQTSPRWKAADAREVTARFEAALARFQPHFHRFFIDRPSTPYGAAPQPPEHDAVLVNGRYRPPTDETPRGEYLFNAGDLANTSWFWSTPLIYHELVPGHHLQIDRIYASRTLSPFRKSLISSGSVEGWAEYARRLAIEAGLYEGDPMARYADRLMDRRMAMMTAADTGMHAKGWSLDQAVQFFSTNAITTKPALQRRAMFGIATEYPGLLLSYWAGGKEFARLRRSVEAAAGPRFDVRHFHEAVLSAGHIPFPVLAARLSRLFGGDATNA